MKKIKYRLVNVPEGGVAHVVPGFGYVKIDESLKDSTIAELIALGFDRYFEPIITPNTDEKDNTPGADSPAGKAGRSKG
jgi:hypothetical protein